MFYNFMYSPTHMNNGVLSARKAMPMKEVNSDGDSSFAMDRRVYMRTPISNRTTEGDTLSVIAKKKWYGGSSVRDSTVVLEKRVKNEVGVGTLNADGNPISFKTVKDVNVTREALVRVRNIGSCVPAKKIHNYANAPVFY
jgi:hypothetical protein